MKTVSRSVFIAFMLLLAIGCNSNHDLSGSVTFPDGSPLDRGMVYFSTPTYIARGTIQPDGSFDVGSLGESDGLPAGTYKVYVDLVDAEEPVTDSDISSPGMPPKLPKIRSLVDRRFCSAETTPLTFTVPGSGSFDFVVERPDTEP